MKVVALVQARMGSTRFPGKVLEPIIGRPMIELLLIRLFQSNKLDEIIVVTSKNPENDHLQIVVESLGFKCYRGSEENVLNRFYVAARDIGADIVVRITGDCPLLDVSIIDACISGYEKSKVDYFSNVDPATYPDGLDVEVMSFESIKRANSKTNSKFDREHVTPYIRNSDIFSKDSIEYIEDLSNLRWSVDEPDDLVVVTNVFEYFSPSLFFDWKQVLKLRELHPELFQANKQIKNNEGAVMGIGQKLYKRAKKVIPGGNMLLSKRPEMFLPEGWPSYFSKAKGCRVVDMDGVEYIDMSIMGIGTNILGYGHPEVDEAVCKAIKDGNMSTLNCPEEVYLAEKLVELHPWSDMVRFARTGGEINSIAIRIARATTGRDKVAICGYHGWHDWYLSTNLNSKKNLDKHLLPGLESNGVPKSLTGTTLPFEYNNINQLEEHIKNNNNEISAIIMEVSRNEGPENNFLQKVRDIASENNIILIFDECTSGFRETFGGLHKKYDVEPDMAIFAKALGNGYAISACIGRQEIMQSAQKTFISSTFWTERIGSAAALKTLDVMEKEKSWNTITKIGQNVSSEWKNLAEKHDLSIETWGLPALSGFTFKSSNALSYKTLITQEMLKKGYLASNSMYTCIEHTQELVNGYLEALDPIFSTIKECEDGLDINSILEGPVCHSAFKRLN
jgi:glutamate-1-semialdehyde 2,1-aminomutase